MAAITLWTTSREGLQSTHKFSSWEGRADEGTRLPVTQPSRRGHSKDLTGRPHCAERTGCCPDTPRSSHLLSGTVSHTIVTFYFCFFSIIPLPLRLQTPHTSAHSSARFRSPAVIPTFKTGHIRHQALLMIWLRSATLQQCLLWIRSLLGTCTNSDLWKMQHERWQGLHQ